MLAKQWLNNARDVMSRIEETQLEKIQEAAKVMADSIEAGRWVHTFGCGHATIPVEEMYPRIGGFVGFHPIVELPLTFFTRITGEMGVHQFVFLERVEGYGVEIMKGMPNAPKAKKTPRKLRFAPLSDSLISDTTALLAPLRTPPPKPKRNTLAFNIIRESA